MFQRIRKKAGNFIFGGLRASSEDPISKGMESGVVSTFSGYPELGVSSMKLIVQMALFLGIIWMLKDADAQTKAIIAGFIYAIIKIRFGF